MISTLQEPMKKGMISLLKLLNGDHGKEEEEEEARLWDGMTILQGWIDKRGT